MKVLYRSLFTTVLLFSMTAHAQEHPSWGYEGDIGPNNWQELDPSYHVCGDGRNQSPINLQHVIDAELPEVNINYQSSVNEVVNNGHTIQVNALAGNTISIDQHSYKLLQFHFHSPSENRINGESFPMEIHFVHIDSDNNLAVLAVMVAEGNENSALQKIWNKMPADVGARSDLAVTVESVSLVPNDKSYYRYNGSLTTPPCSEGVTWLVLKHNIEASKTQIEKFTHVLHHPNNRPQQTIGARLVLE